MRPPAAGADVHFHVAGAGSGIADLDERVTKVRTAFNIGETGMKQTNTLAVQGLQLIAAQALVLPDGLKQTLRRRVAVVAQNRCRPAARTPLGIKGSREVRSIRRQVVT
jgi:hypothetical protein